MDQGYGFIVLFGSDLGPPVVAIGLFLVVFAVAHAVLTVIEILIAEIRKDQQNAHNSVAGPAPDEENYIFLEFSEFVKYYNLNPDRYDCQEYSVNVIKWEYYDSFNCKQRRHDACTIYFTKKDQRKYRKWNIARIRADEKAKAESIQNKNMVKYLDIVQSDIDKCRSEYTKAVETATSEISKINGGKENV